MARNGRKNADSVLIAALASGKTQREAADIAGVSMRTLARRQAEPGFRQQVLEARAAMIERATGKLAKATTRAADALLDLLDDESATVRLSAARALLDYAGKYTETTDITERVSRIEALLEAQQPAPPPPKGIQRWAA